jgi:hypothetical protein
MNRRILIAAAALVLLPGADFVDPSHAGHDHPTETAYGRPGDPAKGGRVVQVAMKENGNGMVFSPARIEVASSSSCSGTRVSSNTNLSSGRSRRTVSMRQPWPCIPIWLTMTRTRSA